MIYVVWSEKGVCNLEDATFLAKTSYYTTALKLNKKAALVLLNYNYGHTTLSEIIYY